MKYSSLWLSVQPSVTSLSKQCYVKPSSHTRQLEYNVVYIPYYGHTLFLHRGTWYTRSKYYHNFYFKVQGDLLVIIQCTIE